MGSIFPFLAVAALGLVVTALWRFWSSYFDDLYVAAAIWLAVCVAYAIIYDWKQASKHQSTDSTQADER
jgi:hypothetical protein